MAYISDEEINEIRSKANIVDIISDYGVNLEKKGKNYSCCCPFHHEKTPSMIVSESKQIFKCFGGSCLKGGNVFNFVQEFEHVSFPEAVKIVADKINYNLKGNFENIVHDKYQKEHDIINLACMFYQNNLNTSSGIDAKKYLLSRHIDDKIIKEFKIGLALDNKNDLYSLLKTKGYEPTLLESLGLVSIIGGKVYDFFNGRITFPIEDINGHTVGFSSRIYRNEKDTSKYINTKETLIYTKGNNMFNYYKAKSAAKKEKSLIIVEGQMDAIRVYSSGILNVVALMGTALTQNQIELIKRLNVKVILCLDGDKAGEGATLINGELLSKEHIQVQVVRLSDYKDPDEYIINKGVEAFKENFLNPIDFIDFKILVEGKNINQANSEELATMINKIIIDVNNIDDPILREITLNKVSKSYNIDISILKSKLDGMKKEEEVAQEVFQTPASKKKLTGLDIAIRRVLLYMMNDRRYIKLYQNKIGYFEDKLYRSLANEIVYYSEKHEIMNMADFISYISANKELNDFVLEIIDSKDSEYTEEEFNNFIMVIEQKSKEQKIKQLKEQIKKEFDLNKKKELLEKIAEIKRGSV